MIRRLTYRRIWARRVARLLRTEGIRLHLKLNAVAASERRKEQACLPRLLLRARSRLIEQHRRALCRGRLGARSRASGLAPPTAGGSSPFLTIALRPASGRLDIFITGRMRFLN